MHTAPTAKALHHKKFFVVFAVAAVAAVGLGGCAIHSSGLGGGDLVTKKNGDEPVLLSWQSTDGGISGSMDLTLPDATYQGRFVQITHDVRESTLAPMWTGWGGAYWGDWTYNDWNYGSGPWDGPVDFDNFSRYYSGKVVANLRDAGGQWMRCRFQLDDPSRGISGGGDGQCQLAVGKTIHAVIDRS